MCGNMDFTGRPTKGFRATGEELKKHEGETSSATKTSRGFFADTDPGGSGALISLRSVVGQGRPLPVSISEFPSAGPTGWQGTPPRGLGQKDVGWEKQEVLMGSSTTPRSRSSFLRMTSIWQKVREPVKNVLADFVR